MTRRDLLLAGASLLSLVQRKRGLPDAPSGEGIFREIASEVGLHFRHFNGATQSGTATITVVESTPHPQEAV